MHAEVRAGRGRRPRVLLVASGGGHWVQLLRLRPAFDGTDAAYVCVHRAYRSDVPEHRFFVVNDATRWNKLGVALQALRMLWIVLRVRPDVVVSTGAAPGYFALRFGKLLGARTAWVDSVANVDQMSMTGAMVRRWADLWMTQWPHLAEESGPTYSGSVL
jgi:UDP-N-acetylglucosamine:LPS N-acetylglucosamine transferase